MPCYDIYSLGVNPRHLILILQAISGTGTSDLETYFNTIPEDLTDSLNPPSENLVYFLQDYAFDDKIKNETVLKIKKYTVENENQNNPYDFLIILYQNIKKGFNGKIEKEYVNVAFNSIIELSKIAFLSCCNKDVTAKDSILYDKNHPEIKKVRKILFSDGCKALEILKNHTESGLKSKLQYEIDVTVFILHIFYFHDDLFFNNTLSEEYSMINQGRPFSLPNTTNDFFREFIFKLHLASSNIQDKTDNEMEAHSNEIHN